jgi:hypothetical protein
MSRATIVKEELTEKNVHLFALYIETRNAALVFLSEGEDQLGTLAASVPPTELFSQAFVSSILLGDKNTGTARMLAERLASKTGKVGLVSVYLRTVSETEATPAIIRLFDKASTLNEAQRKSGKENVEA